MFKINYKNGKSNKKYLVPIILLLMASCYTLLIYQPKNTSETANILMLFPKKVGDWVATEEVKIDPKTITALDPSSLVFRKYENKNKDIVWLCIVYHQNDRWGAHDPQICYKSQGWNLYNYGGRYETRGIPLKGLGHEINRFYVEKEGMKEMVLYWWFGANGKQMGGRVDQLLNMVFTGIFNGYIESGFVRVSIPLRAGSDREDKAKALEFAREVSQVIKNYLPK